VLYLSNNQLTSLPPEIGQLTALGMLYLNNNQLTNLPKEIAGLKKLEVCVLEDNKLQQLPTTMQELRKLRELTLHGNEALGLSAELLGPTYDRSFISGGDPPANPRKILSFYFRIDTRGVALNEFKLILVGRGGVGKTTLVEKLVNDKYRKFPKTPGVKITQWPIKVGRAEARGHVWDFGGQEIMHGTHRFFMTQRAIYLVLVTAREGTEDADAEYWLSLTNPVFCRQ
jgi:internalin A